MCQWGFDLFLVQIKNNLEKVNSSSRQSSPMTEYSSCDAEWEMLAIFGYRGTNQSSAAKRTLLRDKLITGTTETSFFFCYLILFYCKSNWFFKVYTFSNNFPILPYLVIWLKHYMLTSFQNNIEYGFSFVALYTPILLCLVGRTTKYLPFTFSVKINSQF